MSAKYKSKGKNYRAKNQDTIQGNSDNWFPTYHALTRHIMRKTAFDKTDILLEPCAGAGDITKVIKEFYPNNQIKEFDINPKRDGIQKADFLNDIIITLQVDYAITNPPFKLFMEFFKKCTEYVSKGILFIAPLDYLHGVDRYETIYEKGYNAFRLKTVYAFVRRPLFNAKWRSDCLIPTGATSFAWFYFEKHYKGKPGIDWLHNNDDMGTPTEVDQMLFKDIEDKK